MKVDAARICNIHFKEDCFTLEKTKSRKPELAKEILRLKTGSIPTELLNLEKKRKGMMSQSKENSKKVKVSVKSFLPTYSELVQYTRQKQQEEITTNVEIPNMIAPQINRQIAKGPGLGETPISCFLITDTSLPLV